MKLGRFDHHPDPAMDFCIECDVIGGMVADVRVGFGHVDGLKRRVSRAMEFIVGGDIIAIRAKEWLRELDTKLREA